MISLIYKPLRAELLSGKECFILAEIRKEAGGDEIFVSLPPSYKGRLKTERGVFSITGGATSLKFGVYEDGIISPELISDGKRYPMSPFIIEDGQIKRADSGLTSSEKLISMILALDTELSQVKKDIEILKNCIKSKELFTF